jgi:hypothetical protein
MSFADSDSCLPLAQGNILITDYGRATITDVSVHTLANQLLLHPHMSKVSLVKSSIYQAPEFLWPGTDAFVLPTKATDVYALASTIYAVRLFTH